MYQLKKYIHVYISVILTMRIIIRITRLVWERDVILQRAVVSKICHEVVELVRRRFFVDFSKFRRIPQQILLNFYGIGVGGIEALSPAT